MKQTNIFLASYQQPENKLTYAFLSLLEHLSVEVAMSLLGECGVVADGVRGLDVSLLLGGKAGNPDGCIVLKFDAAADREVYFENKTWRRALDLDQLHRHVESWMADPGATLLVVSASRGDQRKVLGMGRASFATWHQVCEVCERLAREVGGADELLLEQFADYLERSEEAWRGRMVSKELLGDFSRHLALKAREQQFCREVWRLMEDLKDKVVPTLNEYVDDAKIAYHWGRIGVECNVKDVVNTRAWVFFGAYLDPSDHGIAQRNENEPDFAIFIDVNPQQRKSLIGAGLDVEIARMLTEVGFKLNFPDNACGNPWRMAYWQVPMRECLDDQPAELAEMFVARLRPLFSSGVLQKIAVDVG